jgi:DNA-directed RNA polymerase subunit RPC12/RpoP
MIEFNNDIFSVECTDPALALTPTQKRTLKRLAFRRPTLMLWVRWGIVPFTAFVSVIVFAILMIGPALTKFGISGPVGGKFVMLALVPIAVIVYRIVARFMRRPYLAAALPLLRMDMCLVCGYSPAMQPDKGRPCPECGVVPASLICPQCGRWLRGLGDDVKRCPECGAGRKIVPQSDHETNT